MSITRFNSPSPRLSIGTIFTIALLLAAGCSSNKPQGPAGPASFWPPAPAEPRVQFLAKFEKSSDVEPPKSKLDELIMGNEPETVLPISKPYGLKMWQGKIYVCDLKQHAVVVLDLEKHLTRMLGVTGAVQLQTPTDIAIGPEGNKYVTDMSRGAIVIFNAQDQYAGNFPQPDFRPVAIAVWKDELAVADFKLQRIQILDRATGSIRRSIGRQGMQDGQFIWPISVAYDPDGNLVVSDFLKCRIQKFDRQGQLIGAFGKKLARAGSFVAPKHVAVDSENQIYVVDASFQNVQMFNKSGQTLTFFGTHGTHPGAMFLPAGICITDDPRNIQLFKNQIHPAFEVKRLILVTNQFGDAKVGVYGFGQLKPGKTVDDISKGRNAVPTGIEVNPTATAPTTLPSLPDEPASPASGPTTPGADGKPATPGTQPNPR